MFRFQFSNALKICHSFIGFWRLFGQLECGELVNYKQSLEVRAWCP